MGNAGAATNSWPEEFTNQYPISKTLRFELIPQGKTQDWIDRRGLLEKDEARSKGAKEVKRFIDDYHRWFIEDVLGSLDLDGWDELAEAIGENRQTAASSSSDSEGKVSNLQDEQRKAIHNAFKSRSEYRSLTDKYGDLLKVGLPKWMSENGYQSEDIEVVKTFDKFTNYFSKLKENRNNMYVAEAQATAIPYRAVNENFSKFVSNEALFDKVKREAPSLASKIDALAPAGSYNAYLSPQGITDYNESIGKINSLLNEQYQKTTLSKRYRAQVLYKQILCEGESSFEAPVQIENDCELFESIEALLNYWEASEEGNPLESAQEIASLLASSDASKLYVSDKSLAAFSGIACESKSELPSAVELCGLEKIGPCAGVNKGTAEKWAERKLKQYSLKDLLEAYAAAYPESAGLAAAAVVEQYGIEISHCLAVVSDTRRAYEQLAASYKSKASLSSKALLSNDDDVQTIKLFLDGIKDLERVLRVFEVAPDVDKEDSFYPVYDNCLAQILCIDALYNRVRNYVTQKPFSSQKFKLNFNCPTLAAGWDKSLERQRLCVLLRRSEKYYLGIMDADNRIDFSAFVDKSGEDCYEKMVYLQVADPVKDLPNLLVVDGKTVSKKGRKDPDGVNRQLEAYKNEYLPEDINRIRKSKSYSKTSDSFSKEDSQQYVRYYMQRLIEYTGDKFEFSFKNYDEYDSYADFLSDVGHQTRCIKFENVPVSAIDSLVDEGRLYLFQIYNKDYSERSTGSKNLHTLYWEQIFSSKNAQGGFPFWLSGNAELFYRPASIKKPVKHTKSSVLLNKTYAADGIRRSIPDAVYSELQAIVNGKKALSDVPLELSDEVAKLYGSGCLEMREAPHEIVKDRRYTKDQYSLHVPIVLNATAVGSGAVGDMNDKVLRYAKDNKGVTVLGIDRGERHLLYLCLIDQQGEILMQKTLNTVSVAQKRGELEIDYHQKLDIREKEREQARKSWSSVGKIAELKQGYLSQVVHEIAEIATENNAIVVMEDLNFGFKRGRFKVEKQVYQKFEKQLIDKFSYLAKKPNEECDIWDLGGIAKAYQLVPKFESFKKLGKQHGAILYVPAWNTSHIDPATGFMNQFRFTKSTVGFWQELFSHMKRISYNAPAGYFEFDFAYSDFPGQMTRGKDYQDSWTVCSWGNGYLVNTKNDKTGKWETEVVDVNQQLKDLFTKEGIDFAAGGDIKSSVLQMEGIKQLGWLFKILVQMRNSRTGTDEDYILSPVRAADGSFFDSRVANTAQPKDADANGAYHIALKGLQALEGAEADKKGNLKVPKTSNEDWNRWIQEFHKCDR